MSGGSVCTSEKMENVRESWLGTIQGWAKKWMARLMGSEEKYKVKEDLAEVWSTADIPEVRVVGDGKENELRMPSTVMFYRVDELESGAERRGANVN